MIARNGNMVTAEHSNGQRITRNVTHFKHIPDALVNCEQEQELSDGSMPAQAPDLSSATPAIDPADQMAIPEIPDNTRVRKAMPHLNSSGHNEAMPRQSTRARSMPVRFKDYVMVHP